MAYQGTSFAAPKLDGEALRRYTSKNIKENIFQEILALPEKGCTEKYSEDTNASEIRVIRQIVPDIKARRMGSDVNGSYFNSNAALLPQSQEYGLKILYMIDDAIDIPTVMDEMVELDVAEATSKAVGGLVARAVNASTIAEEIKAVVNASVAKAETNTVIMGADKNIKDALLEANGKLDNGDEANGVDMFPVDGRQGFLRAEARVELLKNGVVFVGGSNYAQEMLARGVISPNTYKQDKLQFVGEIDQVPFCVVSNVVWKEAEKWLKLDPKKLDPVKAMIVAGMGVGRALAFNNSVKIIDSPNGQGKRAQYKYRWGVECWEQLAVALVLQNGKTLADISALALTIEAPGSQA